MIQSGRAEIQFDPARLSSDCISHFMDEWKRNRPKLVNVNEYLKVWVQIEQGSNLLDMDGTPSFPQMWFEWIWESGREGMLVTRCPAMDDPNVPKGARFLVGFLLVTEKMGRLIFNWRLVFHIDHLGRKLGGLALDGEGEAHFSDQSWLRLYFICDVLTTMNTRGTRIEPPFDSPQARVVKPDRVPCSVWHTIHIPRVPHPPLIGVEKTPEVLERREHWVRATRRDYRFGNGMFGRIKALIWVPEHKRGNPDLGTVCSSYEVKRHDR
jgi:hypothetical protein